MKFPASPEKLVMVIIIAIGLVWVFTQTPFKDINDRLRVSHISTTLPEIEAPKQTGSDSENALVLALGDVAKCKPDNISGYSKLALDYLTDPGIDSHGSAPGALNTSKLIAEYPEAEILGLGDLSYPNGSFYSYKTCFEKYFSAALERFYPAPGNHDYKTAGAKGYFEYWGKRAGPSGKGYYSIDRGPWHIVALNSELDGERLRDQIAWLRNNLKRTLAPCILGFFHRPAYSARNRSGTQNSQALFKVLYDHGASVVLNGHNHFYERTAPLNPHGQVALGRGIRTFVVGTGGRKFAYGSKPKQFTEKLIAHTWGVLKLELEPHSYRWAFLSAPDGGVLDSGRSVCTDRPAEIG